MNKKQFMKIITEVVRKEVKKEVKKIFIKEEASTKLTDIVPEVLEPEEEIQYTKNESLNKVLNETVGLSKAKKEFDEYPTMSGKTFDSSRVSELLGYDKYIIYFPLLKSREKLYQQDCMWKCICKKLNWEFIPII